MIVMSQALAGRDPLPYHGKIRGYLFRSALRRLVQRHALMQARRASLFARWGIVLLDHRHVPSPVDLERDLRSDRRLTMLTQDLPGRGRSARRSLLVGEPTTCARRRRARSGRSAALHAAVADVGAGGSQGHQGPELVGGCAHGLQPGMRRASRPRGSDGSPHCVPLGNNGWPRRE